MPIYEHGYTAWDGERTPLGGRFLLLVEDGLRRALRSKWVWALLVATLVHLSIRGGILYFTGQVQVGQALSEVSQSIRFTPAFLADLLAFQARWVLLVMMVLVASPALARDLRAGALVFYLSKPIPRTGYALGRILPPVLMGLAVTALPAVLLWVLGLAFTPEALWPASWGLLWARAILAGVVASAMVALVALGLSGLLQNTNLAAATWVALALLTAAGARIAVGITGRGALRLIDPFTALDRVLAWTMGVEDVALVAPAWLVVAGWTLAGALAVAAVVRDPEVSQ